MLQGLQRFIATVETSKHRLFVFLDGDILPDNMLVNIAINDAYFLGALSSRVHMCWALAAGGRLGIGNDPRYNKTRCFEPFPSPDCSDEQKQRIRDLGEPLDAHRKRQQAEHPKLTLTNMYNVLVKLRSGENLNEKDRAVHEQGLVSALMKTHDDLDAAVFDAYGWPHDLDDEQILVRLVALNHERAEEEKQGLIRWLRPEYQRQVVKLPKGVSEIAPQTEIAGTEPKKKRATPKKTSAVRAPWPKSIPDQLKAIRDLITSTPNTWNVEEVSAEFRSAPRKSVSQHLETLESLGILVSQDDGDERQWNGVSRPS